MYPNKVEGYAIDSGEQSNAMLLNGYEFSATSCPYITKLKIDFLETEEFKSDAKYALRYLNSMASRMDREIE